MVPPAYASGLPRSSMRGCDTGMYTLRWLRTASLCALSFSAAAAADSYLHTAVFCGEQASGCQQVQRGAVGELLGPYLPLVGMALYSAVFFGTLLGVDSWRKPFLWLGAGGGVGAIALLLAQWFSVGVFCGLCLGTNLAAFIVALLSVRALYRGATFATGWPMSAWVAMYVLFVATPPVYALAKPQPVPGFVESRALDDRIDVIEVSDFRCPSCRSLHGVLAPMLAKYRADLNHVRLPFPLAGHPQAHLAARAYWCAREQGQGEILASQMFAADTLSEPGLAEMSGAIGLSVDEFQACVRSPQTRYRIDEIKRKLGDHGVTAVPLVWIEGRSFRGFERALGGAPYAAALREAAAGRPVRTQPLPFIALGLVVAALVTWAARRAKLGPEG